VSPADLLALPASVYEAFLVAVLERDEQMEADRRARKAEDERRQLLADFKARNGR